MPASHRHDRIDALRGAAVAWMTLYHFGFDLNHFGYWQQDFYRDPVWTLQRTVILSLFLFCAGLGQAFAMQRGQTWQAFWRRWAQIAGCALLVTAGSALMFPRSVILFGVLHGIAVMLVLTRLTAGWGRWLWLAGAAAILLAHAAGRLLEGTAAAPVLNGTPLNWLGLITVKPVTEDYVPVLPWLGVMWWGMASGQWLLRVQPAWLHRPATIPPTRALAWMGRWSLSWYMVHQPVLIGGLMLAGWVRA